MGGDCRDKEFWDALLKGCVDCGATCRQQHVIPRCTSYCGSIRCKSLQGFYYDPLLKRCMQCTKTCSRPTAECSPYCQTPQPLTQTLQTKVPSHRPDSGGLAPLENSAILFYSVLAVCMVLLFASLSLALTVLLKIKKRRTDDLVPAGGKTEKNQGDVPPKQERGVPGNQRGNYVKGFPASPACPANREPSDDSIPTETCVCVHCFPDLKALGQSNDRPQNVNFSFYQPAVLHRTAHWTVRSHHDPSGQDVQEEAALG